MRELLEEIEKARQTAQSLIMELQSAKILLLRTGGKTHWEEDVKEDLSSYVREVENVETKLFRMLNRIVRDTK